MAKGKAIKRKATRKRRGRVVRKQVTRAGRVVPAAIPQNSNLLVIEDNTIRTLLADPRYLEAIPCLKSGKRELASIGRRCARCSRKRLRMRKQAFQHIRQCIAGLSPPQKVMFKKLLGAKQVRVVLGNAQHVTL